MQALFASGLAVDIVLAVMAVEIAILSFRGRGDIAGIALSMLPGALMLLALRCALTGAGWPAIALLLAASFPAHIADLARRGW